MIIQMFELGILKTNCYVIYEEILKKGIVVDPGTRDEVLTRFIQEQKLIITHICITHGHFDHVGGVNWLKNTLDYGDNSPKIVMSFLEKEDMEKNAPSKYQKHFFDADIDVTDGQILDFGFLQLKVLLLPGHTNYSVCYYSEAKKMVLVGDTLFYHSIGTEAYYDGPATDLSDNIMKVLFTLPGETVVYCGHKQETSIQEEKLYNPYLSDADTIDPWL